MTVNLSAGGRRRLSAEQRRAVVFEAAARVFAERGYTGASIDRIAAEAGISPPIVYRHFGSKKALYLELLQSSAMALIEATTRDEGLDSAGDILRQNTEAFFRFVQANPAAWRILFLDPAPDPEIAEAQRQIQAAATAQLANVIVARVDGLRVSADIPRAQANELIAQAGKSALNGLAAWWWDHPELTAETLSAVALDLLWTGLGNLGERPAAA
jgi:AcrR family transcriptional regulator